MNCVDFEKTPTFSLLKTNTDQFFIEFYKPENDNSRKSIISILNYFETVSSAISEELLDDKFAERYFDNIFSEFYREYIIFIEERRKRKNVPTLYIEFTSLASKWNSKFNSSI
jgi:ribosomal protein S2